MSQRRALDTRRGGRGPVLKQAIAAGANTNVSITVTGLGLSDEIVSVFELQPPTASSGSAIANDRTSVATIYAADTLRINANTTGNQILITWWGF
jgi:hypothetical protein